MRQPTFTCKRSISMESAAALACMALICFVSCESKEVPADFRGNLQALSKSNETVRLEIRHISSFKTRPIAVREEDLESAPDAILILQDRPNDNAIGDLLHALARCSPHAIKGDFPGPPYWLIRIGTPQKPNMGVVTFNGSGRRGMIGDEIVDIPGELRAWIKARLSDSFSLVEGADSEPILEG